MLTSASVAAGVAGATAKVAKPESARAAKDMAERIFDTRKMNCSYIAYAPFIMKDPNTGAMSGLFYDLTQKIGELADIEMNWNVETTYAALGEDLNEGKFDLFAGGIWPDAKRAPRRGFF